MTPQLHETVTLPRGSIGPLIGDIELADPHRVDVVLYVHGFGSDRKGNKTLAVKLACRRFGLNFAAFDFHCHGESGGVRMTDLRASRLQEDLARIGDHLASRGIGRLHLVGSSMGGFAGSWFAKAHPDAVAALVLIAPAFRFLDTRLFGLDEEQLTRWKQQRTMRVKNQWLDVDIDYGLIEEREQFVAERLADEWRTPALIFHGMNDETVPWRDTLSVVERAAFPDVELRLLKGGDHRLLRYAEVMAEEACRFFKRHGA